MALHPKLAAISCLMDGLSAMLGPHYELILHDLHDPAALDHTVIAVAGNVTGRAIGSPATNYLCSLLSDHGDDAPNRINYRNITRKGRVLRSSTIFIRDDNGHIIGSLCANQDMTALLDASRLMQEMVAFEGSDGGEEFIKDVSEVKNTAEKLLASYPVPTAFQKKKDRIKQMLELNELGFFDLTDSVKILAQHFGLDPTTIYLYLREIRSAKTAG
ncbi:MAG: PAS domain-containing protein [Eubacteriales bacterium]|nr:PAS domain-containing protein [Eubacteriales bacterium]